MPELTRHTEQQILSDIRQDSMTAQALVDRLMSNTATNLDYRDLDMLHYIVKTMESRVRILRGYDR